MRSFVILAAAGVGFFAGTTLAGAQATNFAPRSGTAPALYGSSDARGYRGMERETIVHGQRWYRPGYHAYGYSPRVGYRHTEGIPPALYHAGDPQYWR